MIKASMTSPLLDTVSKKFAKEKITVSTEKNIGY